MIFFEKAWLLGLQTQHFLRDGGEVLRGFAVGIIELLGIGR